MTNTRIVRTRNIGKRLIGRRAGRRGLGLGLAALVTLTAACSGQSTASEPSPGADTSGPGLSKVLLLGDSVAVGQALPMSAAFEAGGVAFESAASTGGGNVVGPFSDEQWKKLPEQISSAGADAVVYQLTTYDWGTRQEQRAGYEKLLATVTDAGARLVFVTMPPIKAGDFYKPHMAELKSAPEVARAVAAGSSGKADFLDASAVWGSTYQRVKDGKADRSSDGIHTCPQGAARFTSWLLTELAELFPGFTPPDPRSWANTGWSASKTFKGC
ncbi:SGNH/GDSL hydrolase family protein [Actinomadura welshii]